MIGTAMAVIGRSFKQHLLSLAEEKFGEPPIPYCFLALGSMARDEQLLITDQDNALLFDNDYRPKEHEEYFIQLAKFVSDGLAACGYTYCSGDIMATNPQWRKTFTEWQECFADWIDNPEPQALLNSSIFFDLDGVWGETKLADTLKRFVAQHAKGNARFLASLARNALNRTPPLGFFKNFVMEPDGRHGKSINLKRRGTAPLSDVIRVHALAVGSDSQNSFERLDDIIAAGILPDGKGRELSDALEYISMVRIRHQAQDVENGQSPENTINPTHLSTFEKRNLREAFQILDKAQQFLKYRYTAQSALK
jgi:CBS domain-containing protein